MRKNTIAIAALVLGALIGCTDDAKLPSEVEQGEVGGGGISAAASQTFPVAGGVVYYLSQEVVHSQQPTTNGLIQLSTVMVRLTGDLDGWVLFQPVGTFDFAAQTLVNTGGKQVFSGTVKGLGPVMLHDADFVFDLDLTDGSFVGDVSLGRSKDSPGSGWFECHLTVIGTGAVTPEGDTLSDYTGECSQYGNVPIATP